MIRIPKYEMLRGFLRVFVAFSILLGVVGVLHYFAEDKAHRSEQKAHEAVNVDLARRVLEAELDNVTADLMFLTEFMETFSYEKKTRRSNMLRLTDVFFTFADSKIVYDQIRFIDNQGQEVVRVNFNEGEPIRVREGALQDKSSRYYVQEGLRLEPGDVYVSPLDLNIEAGEIEQPIRPMLRFVAPVIDLAGLRQGMIVLNYHGSRLLERFHQAAVNIQDHVELLNSGGYWLSSPREGEAWAFLFGHTIDSFKRRFPEAWKQFETQDQGQFLSSEGLFTFARLGAENVVQRRAINQVPRKDSSKFWVIVSHLSLRSIVVSPALFLKRNGELYLGMLMLMGILSFLVARAQMHRLVAETWREHERGFRHTLEDIQLAAVMVDLDGVITFCNEYLLELSGWTRDEVVGQSWLNLFVPEERLPEMRRMIATLDASGELPSYLEGALQTRGGEVRQIAWHNTQVRDIAGKIIGVTAVGEDITVKKSLEESTRKLTRATEQSPSIVTITDRAGNIEYTNPKFTEMTGYTFKESGGGNPKFLKSGDKPKKEYQEMWETISAGGQWRGEFHNKRKDGSLFWTSAVLSGLRDVDGNITHYLSVQEDITERKRLEQEVELRNRELTRAHTLAEMGRMSSMIAHDLRNPLSSIKMSLQMLGRQVTEKDQEMADIGLEQVRYMEDIITDMLVYSRPEAIKTEWLAMDKLINAVMNNMRKRIDEHQTTVEVEVQGGLPAFPGDSSKLKQLFGNLLINAIQATSTRPAGKRKVTVEAFLELGEPGTRIRVEICDNGDGLETGDLEKLFQPFYTTRAKGTGLGLAIVQRIAEQHNADIELRPSMKQGVCAVVWLSLVPGWETEETPDRLEKVVT